MLNEQRKRFVDELIRLKCRNRRQAAINAGYSEKTASQQATALMKNYEVLEYYEARKTEVAQGLQAAFVFEASEALDEMVRLLKDPKTDARVRYQIAKDIMDRAGFKPLEKSEITGKNGGPIVFGVEWGNGDDES